MSAPIRVLSSSLVLVLCAGLSCTSATTTGSGVPRFPTRSAVDDLLASQAPSGFQRDARYEPTAHTLTGPLPTMGGDVRRAPTGPFETLLAKERPDLVVTEPLVCAARELGQIFADHGLYAGTRLMAHVLGACGHVTESASVQSLAYGSKDAVTDEQILTEGKDSLTSLVRTFAPTKGMRVGLAVVRGAKHTVIFAVASSPNMAIEPFSLVPNEKGEISISGDVLVRADGVTSLANHGTHDVARCVVDARLILPKLRVTCPLRTVDVAARVEAAGFERDRIIGPGLFSILARPSGAEPLQYTAVSPSPATTVSDGRALALALTGALNAVRKEAGRAPLALASAQSETGSKLAPHLFSRLLTSTDDRVTDEIALAMLAGWNVADAVEGVAPGEVVILQDGDFGFAWGDTLDAGVFLERLLDQPRSRVTLLDPRYDVVAIGTQVEGAQGFVGIFFGAWERFAGHDVDVDSKRVFDALQARRKHFGSTGVIPHIDTRVRDAARAIDANGDVEDEVGDALNASVKIMQTKLWSWTLTTNDLDEVPFPSELIDQKDVYVSVGVAFARDPNDAWGRYVILLIAHVPEGATMTSLDDEAAAPLARRGLPATPMTALAADATETSPEDP